MIKKILLFLLIGILCQSVFVQAQNADIDILKRINGWDSRGVRNFSDVISTSQEILIFAVPTGIALYGLIADDDTSLDKATSISLSVLGTLAVSQVLKMTIDRQRPFEKYPHLITPRDHPTSASFPSGHTSGAFALATSLSLEYPKWYVIAPSMLWAASVGFARMNQGVHYPSDVLGGMLLGAGGAYLSYRLNKYWHRKRDNRPLSLALQYYNLP